MDLDCTFTPCKKMMKKFYSKYKAMSLPLKVSLWFFACSLLQKGLSFITTPIFTRILSTDDYGLISVFNSWEQIAVIFVTLSLANSVFNVGLVHNPDDRDNFQSSMVGLSIVSALFFTIVIWAGYSFIEPVVQLESQFVVLMLVFCFFSTVIGMWSLRERFEYHYKKMVFITATNTIVGTALSLLFVFYMDEKAWAKVLGTAAVTIVLGFFCCFDFIKKSKKLFNLKYWKFALKYNVPMMPHFLSSVLLSQVDRIMIKGMCGAGFAGIYSVAYNSAGVVYIVNQALSASYNPWLLQRLKSERYEGVKDVVNAILLGYVLLLFLLILFAPEIMKIMAPAEYQEGIYIIPPVACSMFFIMLFNVFAPVEHFSLKTKFIALASTVSAIAKVVLNLFFIAAVGYLAAGYTTLVCYILYAYAHYVYMKRVCVKNMNGAKIFDEHFILLLSFVVVALSILTACLYEYVFVRYTLILTLVILLFFKRKKFINVYLQVKGKKK